MTVDQIHPADEMPAVREHFEAILAGTGATGRVIRCLRRDGTVRLVNIDGSAIVLDGVQYLVGFFTDVTEARRLEVAGSQARPGDGSDERRDPDHLPDG